MKPCRIIRSLEEIITYDCTTPVYLLKTEYIKSRGEYRHSFHEVFFQEADGIDEYFGEIYGTGVFFPVAIDKAWLIVYSGCEFDTCVDFVHDALTEGGRALRSGPFYSPSIEF